MSLIDLVVKLINEHGSFKQGLELLAEQISILEKENRALKEQVSIPEKENRVLKEQLSILEKEYRALEERVSIPERENRELKEQTSILEKEYRALKSEQAILKGKEETIESKLNKAAKKPERLNEAIKVPKKDGQKSRLDAVTEKILRLFFDTGQELSVNQAAGKLSMNISIVQSHFDLLLEAKLIVEIAIDDKASWARESTPALYELSHSGRKYIIEHKILT